MRLALRAMQSLLAGIALLIQLVVGLVLLGRYGSVDALAANTLPFPLVLPLVLGALGIAFVEVLVYLMTNRADDGASEMSVSVPFGERVHLPDTTGYIGRNLRWDLDSENEDS